MDDIIRSFLADVADDGWSENFQFFDVEADDIDLVSTGFIGKATSTLSKSHTADRESASSDDNSTCSSPAYSQYSDSDSEDEMLKSLCEDGWDWAEQFDLTVPAPVQLQYEPVDVKPIISSVAPSTFEGQIGSKKRKADEQPSKQPRETIEMKKAKQSPEEKVVSVVAMLRTIRQKNASRGVYKHPDPVGTAESLVKTVLASKSTSPADLLKIFSPSATLRSTALSSLHSQAQEKRNKMNLCAWMPPKQIVSKFPEKHNGVGQIAGATRSFVSSISDLMGNHVSNKVQFEATLLRDSVMVSATGDQLASQFVWRSRGLVAQGITSELEFNGLIRCTFSKDGVSSATISFDAFTPARQCASLSV